MKIRPVVAELFHAEGKTDEQRDGRTDVTKPTVAFRKFANASKKGYISYVTDIGFIWDFLLCYTDEDRYGGSQSHLNSAVI